MSDAPLLICKKAPNFRGPVSDFYVTISCLRLGEDVSEGSCFVPLPRSYLKVEELSNNPAELSEMYNVLCELESSFVLTVHYQRGGPSVKCHRAICHVQNSPIVWFEGGNNLPFPNLYSHVNSMNIT